MKTTIIRLAEAKDAEAIREIYAPYVETTVTFEETLPAVDEFWRRIVDTLCNYPYLVCERDDRIVGYAYAHSFRERAAYRWNAELSVYVSNEHLGFGVGKQLYAALIELLTLQNIQKLYGIVTYPNSRSEALHRHFGFDLRFTDKNAGFKCGRWIDVLFYVRDIGIHEIDPKEMIPFSQLDSEKISAVLNHYRIEIV
jgi:phosphinothricin acetyltransferase